MASVVTAKSSGPDTETQAPGGQEADVGPGRQDRNVKKNG